MGLDFKLKCNMGISQSNLCFTAGIHYNYSVNILFFGQLTSTQVSLNHVISATDLCSDAAESLAGKSVYSALL